MVCQKSMLTRSRPSAQGLALLPPRLDRGRLVDCRRLVDRGTLLDRGTLWLAVCLTGLLGACSGSSGNAGPPRDGTEAEQAKALSAPTSEAASLRQEAPREQPLKEPSPVEAEPVEPLEPPPLPEGTVVLHVGSSSAGALGLELKKKLEAQGVKCILRAKESTFIPQWAGEKMGLRQMLSQYKPDLVIVSLGGNETQIPDPTQRARAIQRLVKMVGDRPCVWVGTPKWKRLRHTGLLDVIRDNAAPCHFIDSDSLAPNLQTLKDGVHPTYPERGRWAERVIQWLRFNRDPEGERPWSFKEVVELPPDESESALLDSETR